jgi:threonine aldolase
MNDRTWIDLRSDTVTRPTSAMRKEMMEARVGDDVYRDDPDMNDFEREVAALFEKDDAVFVPSGTFSNQLALMTHCEMGDEVIVDQQAHIVQHEAAASSVIASVQLFTLESDQGIWDLDKLDATIKQRALHTPATSLICMENAFGGRALPLSYMQAVRDVADAHGVKVHLDGARVFNAATALGCHVSELAACADSVSVCLSKGLGAPIGSVLVGDQSFIDEARRNRKIMGGGMRQVGFLARAGMVAVRTMSERLAEDHAHADYMASLLKEIPGVTIDDTRRDINMVFFDVDDPRKHQLRDYLWEHGVKINPHEGGFRFVTHHDVSRADIEEAIGHVDDFFAG